MFKTFFYNLTWYFIWLVFKFFNHLKVVPSEKLCFERPLILAANHLSLMDPFLIGACFRLNSGIHPLNFMVHDKWIKIPFWGLFIKSWGGFPAYVGHGLENSLRKPREILKTGGNILIFPQGKRMADPETIQAKVGTAVLSLTTKIKILPIKICDTYPGSLWNFFLRKRKIKIFIGQPFSLTEKINKFENYTQTDFEQAKNVVMKEINKLA